MAWFGILLILTTSCLLPTTAPPADTTAPPADTTANPVTTTKNPPRANNPPPEKDTSSPGDAPADCLDPGYCEVWDPVKCVCDCPDKKGVDGSPDHFMMCPYYNIPHLKHHCYNMPCAATTVWEQSQCRCIKPTKKTAHGSRRNKIGTCDLLIDYRYSGESGVFTDFKKNHMRAEKSGSHIHVDDVLGATYSGKAARFDGMSLRMPILEYNDLGDTMLLELRVQPGESPQNNTEVILSNECYTKDKIPKKDPGSIELSYLKSTNTFEVVITTKVSQHGSCAISADANGWYDISISVKSSATKVMINDKLCTEFIGEGPITKNSCPLTIGGAPLAKDNDFDYYGHLDFIRLFKYCHREPRPT